MTDADQRVEELERRVAQLETLVRQLATRSLAAPDPAPLAPTRRVEPPVPRPSAVARPVPSPQPTIDWEQWVGRRALLAVGVLALIATTGFFVKYAIDRGWISPWLRVNGGVLLGALLAIWGDRLISRGLRAYGGAIIGAGGGLAYLALWAAAAPYGLIGPNLGILLLLGVTVSIAARAVRHRVEGLCAWALVGAFGAPFFIEAPSTQLATLLTYLGVVAIGCGAIAVRLEWRRTFALAVAGFYLMPLFVPAGARADPSYALYLIAGGAGALVATERPAWPESRLFALLVGWAILIGVADASAMAEWRWLTLGGAFVLALVAWRHHVARDPFASRGTTEIVVYLVSPWAAVVLAATAGPRELANAQGVVPGLLALPYLAAGWPRRSTHLVVMGFALTAAAIAGQWDGLIVAVAWSGLALLAVAADRWNGQPAGRPAAMGLATLGLLQLFLVGVGEQVFHPGHGLAFRDSWSFAWYGCPAAAAGAARMWRLDPVPAWLRGGRAWLWSLAGGSLWLGGSLELSRAFDTQLATDLAISAFWVIYAGVLVAVGFRLGQRAVRVGGLALAGLGAFKIVLYDLSQLEALYRVGSFFALAVIALAVAYAYNRRETTPD